MRIPQGKNIAVGRHHPYHLGLPGCSRYWNFACPSSQAIPAKHRLFFFFSFFPFMRRHGKQGAKRRESENKIDMDRLTEGFKIARKILLFFHANLSLSILYILALSIDISLLGLPFLLHFHWLFTCYVGLKNGASRGPRYFFFFWFRHAHSCLEDTKNKKKKDAFLSITYIKQKRHHDWFREHLIWIPLVAT